MRLVSSPPLAALRRTGTAHVYADTADSEELRRLLAVEGGGMLAEIDGNTVKQPLARQVLDRYLTGDRRAVYAQELRRQRQGTPAAALLPHIYTMVSGWIGNDLVSAFAAGRDWEVSLQLHMGAVSDPETAKSLGRDLAVDIVLECTGVFTHEADLKRHAQAGAKFVILSAPLKGGDDVPTVVHGVTTADRGASIISCASCTTNCITPVIEILGRRIGILKATMTTVHAYTASQALVDRPSKDRRRGRAAATNLVPSSTGAAKATIKALPEYQGKFDGVAIRAPVPAGSIADIVCVVGRRTSTDEVNSIFREEARSARYRAVVGVSEEAIVSTDIIQDPRASIIDCTLTQVVDGDLVKVMSWYDNEWGYAAQLIREAKGVARID